MKYLLLLTLLLHPFQSLTAQTWEHDELANVVRKPIEKSFFSFLFPEKSFLYAQNFYAARITDLRALSSFKDGQKHDQTVFDTLANHIENINQTEKRVGLISNRWNGIRFENSISVASKNLLLFGYRLGSASSSVGGTRDYFGVRIRYSHIDHAIAEDHGLWRQSGGMGDADIVICNQDRIERYEPFNGWVHDELVEETIERVKEDFLWKHVKKHSSLQHSIDLSSSYLNEVFQRLHELYTAEPEYQEHMSEMVSRLREQLTEEEAFELIKSLKERSPIESYYPIAQRRSQALRR